MQQAPRIIENKSRRRDDIKLYSSRRSPVDAAQKVMAEDETDFETISVRREVPTPLDTLETTDPFKRKGTSGFRDV